MNLTSTRSRKKVNQNVPPTTKPRIHSGSHYPCSLIIPSLYGRCHYNSHPWYRNSRPDLSETWLYFQLSWFDLIILYPRWNYNFDLDKVIFKARQTMDVLVPPDGVLKVLTFFTKYQISRKNIHIGPLSIHTHLSRASIRQQPSTNLGCRQGAGHQCFSLRIGLKRYKFVNVTLGIKMKLNFYPSLLW